MKKKVNSKSSKRNYSSARQGTSQRRKPKKSFKLALFLAYIAVVLICQLVKGTTIAIGVAGLLAVLALFIKIFSICRGQSKRKFLTVIMLLFLTIGIICLAMFAVFLLYIKAISDPLYDEKQLNTKEITTLYDKDGNEFAKLGSEMRENVTYEELPEVLVDAIVATEDSRFFTHNGFDAPRFIKATAGQFLGNSGAGGASTLSMQVVKNSFTDASADSGIKGIIRKFKDIYLSVFKLEKNFTKEDIVVFYVNNHFLGGNVYGVKEASRTYFGKNVSELNLSEAAILAGMFKSPNAYRPNVNPENAEARRATVLNLMQKHGYITKEEEAAANAIPAASLVADSNVEEQKYQGYIDTVVAEVKEEYGVNPYTTSLKIYTSLDRGKQDAIDRVYSDPGSLGTGYYWPDDQLQAAVSVVDVTNGEIAAIGAGRNRTGLNSFNFATQLERQPGSTAKPIFDYGPAIEYLDWSTGQPIVDEPYTYTGGRSISNWDNRYMGAMTIRRALALSRNIPALKTFKAVNNADKLRFATNMGIIPEVDADELEAWIQDPDNNGAPFVHEAHSIGAFTGVSPLQMAAAYATFANAGKYNKPHSVRKIIYRSTGEEEVYEGEEVQAMSDATAFMITKILQEVSLNGSGYLGNLARKTGTTNFDDNTVRKYGMAGDAIRDSWVVGYTPQYAMSMWYGYDKLGGPYMHNVESSVRKDKLYRAFVAAGAIGDVSGNWSKPDSVEEANVVIQDGQLYLGDGQKEYFKKGTTPSKRAHVGPIGAPGSFKASYNDATNKVTLNWSDNNPGITDDSGSWIYEIYFNGAYVTTVNGNTYTYSTSYPYGTYKIHGKYENSDSYKSEDASVTLTEPKKPEPEKEPEKEPESSTETE